MSENFDMTEYFNSLPVDPTKKALFSALYRIETICQQNWDKMPGDVQSSIIDEVQKALETVRRLPDGLNV